MSAQLAEPDLETYRREHRARVDRARRNRLTLARLRGEDTSMRPAEPVRERIVQLVDVGWTLDAICVMNGSTTQQALRLIVRGVTQHVEPRTARIAELPVTVAAHPDLPDGALVPVLGVTRRVRALLRLGYPHDLLSVEVGRSTHVFATAQYRRTRAGDWRAVDAAYERLSGRRGPSETTALRAAQAGYPAPLAWDDIDDPHEQPTHVAPVDLVDEVAVERILAGDRLKVSRSTRLEVIRRWDRSGRTRRDLARQTGWKPERYLRLEGGDR